MKKTVQYVYRLMQAVLLLPALAQADIIINEVDADNPGTDTAEFVELYDGGTGNTALDGLALVFYNGSNDSSYLTIDLTGKQTSTDGYFVICGDASNLSHCDLDVSPNSNLIQNGADAVALYRADASLFTKGTAVTTQGLLDAIIYDTNDKDDTALLVLLNASEPQVNEAGHDDSANHSNQRCSNGAGGGRNTQTFTQAKATPGQANHCPVAVEIGQCGEPATPIHAIQGAITTMSHDESPLLGSTVVVEAIVTKDLQGGALANGESSLQYSSYWLQEEQSDDDNNSLTSEGIRVFDTVNPVNQGDKVRMVATVSEHNGVTQLSAVNGFALCAENQPLPHAINLQLPVTSPESLEALEGMLVINEQGLIVSDLFGVLYGFGNNGQFGVSSELLFNPTEIAAPGSEAYKAALRAKQVNYLLIDDGVSAANPSFIPYPDETGFSAVNPMRIGYKVPSVAGVLHGYNDYFMIIPADIRIEASNERTSKPSIDDSANLVIVGMNVLNYFNGNGQGGGFPAARGAPTERAFMMQKAKIVAALDAMDADVIALMEIENDGYTANSAINDLVTALNTTQIDDNHYAFIQPEGRSKLGDDAIAVGLLYRTNKLSKIGETVVLDSSNSPTDNQGALFDDKKNRPSLIQSFRFNGFDFTLSVNHLKSKGSQCNEPNEGSDGQGNCNNKRTRAAAGLATFLATKPTGIDTDAVMILGDLNAYSQEDPIQALESAGYRNLKYSDKSTEAMPYSYSFGGFLGSLDHAMARDTLAEKVVSVDAWHINSVEDSMMDYLTEANGQPHASIDRYANDDPYRSSDHDPIIVALSINGQSPVSPDTENETLPQDILMSGRSHLYILAALALLTVTRRRMP